jgi:hypothetical protein
MIDPRLSNDLYIHDQPVDLSTYVSLQIIITYGCVNLYVAICISILVFAHHIVVRMYVYTFTCM